MAVMRLSRAGNQQAASRRRRTISVRYAHSSRRDRPSIIRKRPRIRGQYATRTDELLGCLGQEDGGPLALALVRSGSSSMPNPRREGRGNAAWWRFQQEGFASRDIAPCCSRTRWQVPVHAWLAVFRVHQRALKARNV